MNVLRLHRGWPAVARYPAAALVLAGMTAWATPAPVPASIPIFRVDDIADGPDANPLDGVCLTDLGTCTLRAAIQQANASGGPRTILLPPGVYEITIPGEFEDAGARGDLDIASDLRLVGEDARTTKIDANGIDRVFHVHPGAQAIFRRLTIRGGGIDDSGGGISNAGRVQLYECTLFANVAVGDGGGLFNSGTGEAAIVQSTLFRNSALNSGGGIANAGRLRIVDSTLSRNRALFGFGAAQGGGLRNLPTGTARLTNATLADNGSVGMGGNLLIDSGGLVVLLNTIVANALRGGDCRGSVSSEGHNLDSDGTCSLTAPGDISGVDPGLRPLSPHGGETDTHALREDSPAIDAGTNEGCPLVDQRGVVRPLDGDGDGIGVCDIGAYERR